MNVRFSGVRVTAYVFDPAQVQVPDRMNLSNFLLGAMAQNLKATQRPMTLSPELQALVARHADRFEFQAVELVRPLRQPHLAVARPAPAPMPEPAKSGWNTFLPRLFAPSATAPLLAKAPPPEPPTPPEIQDVQLAAFIFHGKTNGRTNLYTVALDRHDSVVADVIAKDKNFPLFPSRPAESKATENSDPYVTVKETAATRVKEEFCVPPDYIGTVILPVQIPKKFEILLPNLERALTHEPRA